MLVLYPTLRPLSQWWGRVVTTFEANGKEVWLTIDDGPTADTPAILDLLDRHHANATFFVKGLLVEKDSAAIRLIVDRGHGIGNHSHTHPSGSFWCKGPGRIDYEVAAADAALAAAGVQTRLFRAPVGMKNWFVHPILEQRGKSLIGWSVRAFDGVRFDPRAASESILASVQPGAIILLHEGRIDPDTGARLNVDLLTLLLQGLALRGYRAVLPDETRFRPADDRR